jgi:hypothetical protein
MYRIRVESATLSAVGYDSERRLLELEFDNTSVYQYFDVPAEVPAELLAAHSKGRFFNQRIRGRYAYRRAESVAAR